jgi:transcriptional regulator of arginine metabolism
MSHAKHERQSFLIDLIRRQPVSTQQEIVQHMMESGFTVTQSSVSRDIRELGLIKTGGRYVLVERTTDSVGTVSSHVGPGLVTAIETAGSTLIVVRSTEGSASAVALALDRLGLPDIVGTIAGDDTVFVAVRSRSAQGRVVARLHGWLRPPPVRHAATTSAAPVGAL